MSKIALWFFLGTVTGASLIYFYTHQTPVEVLPTPPKAITSMDQLPPKPPKNLEEKPLSPAPPPAPLPPPSQSAEMLPPPPSPQEAPVVIEKLEKPPLPPAKKIVLLCQHPASEIQIPEDLQKNSRSADILSPMWFDIKDDGQIAPRKEGIISPATPVHQEFCKQNNILLMPIFRNFSPKKLLSHPEVFPESAHNIVAMVQQEKYDGIMLDIEEVSEEYREPMNQLASEIRNALSERHYKFAIAVPCHGRAWDYKFLSENADYLLIMFYDYVGTFNKKYVGATAPYKWTERGRDIYTDLNAILATGASPQKLLFGVPTYGNTFTLNAEGHWTNIETRYLRNLVDTKAQYQAERLWNDEMKAPYFEYQKNQTHYQVWYEDAESFDFKFQTADKNNLAGIGCWAIGSPSSDSGPDFWPAVEKYKAAPRQP
ncbi:MAG: glycosyl hydrolase family 18 protein [Verrucomicrobiota bacterium]